MRSVLSIVAALLTSCACCAEIEEWGGASPSAWTSPDDVNITILASGTFKFQSVVAGNPAAIGTITIDSGVTSGTVTVHIERDPNDVGSVNGLPGATSIGSIDLTTAGVTGELEFLHITGNFGTTPMTTSEVTAVTGDIIIGDSTADDLQRSLTVTSGVNGNIFIAGDVPSGVTLTLGNMDGNLTIGRNLDGTVTATSIDAPDKVLIERALLGTLNVGTMTGDIQVDLTLNGAITAASLAGDITLNSGGWHLSEVRSQGTFSANAPLLVASDGAF